MVMAGQQSLLGNLQRKLLKTPQSLPICVQLLYQKERKKENEMKERRNGTDK